MSIQKVKAELHHSNGKVTRFDDVQELVDYVINEERKSIRNVIYFWIGYVFGFIVGVLICSLP